MTIEAVTFDHWNTLVYAEEKAAHDHRLDRWIGVLEGVGFAVERERLDAAFASSWARFQTAWKANEKFSAAEAAVLILEELGFDVPAEVHDRLVALYSELGPERHLHLCDNARETLKALKDAGVRIGIICDVGLTPSTALRANLEREGVLGFFDHWSFSDEVGSFKPAREIFEHALAGLGDVASERTAHIGDLRRTDVAGAQAMGMVAVRYAGVFDDIGEDAAELPEADHVITDLAALPEVLGVA